MSDGFDWGVGGNWSTGAAPGATSGFVSTDIATFNSADSGLLIVVDSGRNVLGLTFGAMAGDFSIGGLGANGGESLNLSNGGSIALQAGFAGTGITIDAPLVLHAANASSNGTYVFSNNTSAAATSANFASVGKLNITGNIEAEVTSGSHVLTLSGTVGTRNAGNESAALSHAMLTISVN